MLQNFTCFFFFQFYLVMKGHGKQQEEQTSLTNKSGQGKFVTSKARVPQNSCVSQVSAIPQSQIQPPQPPVPVPPAIKQNNPTVTGATTVEVTPQPPIPPGGGLKGGLKSVSDQDIEQELDRILAQLQLLSKSTQEKGLSKEGLTLKKITAMQEALKAASAVPPASASTGNGLNGKSNSNAGSGGGGSNSIAGSNGSLVGGMAVAALTNNGSVVKSVEAVKKEAVCMASASASPAESAPVQVLNNGQVVHCRSSPLQPVQPPLHLPASAGLPPSGGLPTCCPTSLNKSPSNCDSPVIVHQYSERPSRVSFDLAQEPDGLGLGLPVNLHDPTDPCAADSTAVEVFLEPPGGSTSDMSGSGSCHR